MCGIAGFIDRARPPAEELERRASWMAQQMRLRGPDHQQGWADGASGVGLGHARLSIIDLSTAANQPMVSRSSRFVLTFNGEIFNFKALRDVLAREGVEFHTDSDTEVLLNACEHWGVERAVRAFVGMFAFGLWDRQTRELTLVRDRLGIKPLYYGSRSDHFFFASELKPLAEFLADARLDPVAIGLLLRHGYIGAPRSIFRGLYKLPPATILTVSADDPESWSRAPRPYWDAGAFAIAGSLDPLPKAGDAICEPLLQQLRESVQLRMVADVPIGAFLSGGVDSSLVTALMKEARAEVQTFSIGFDDAEFDESHHAKQVASYLGTEHVEFRVTAKDAVDTLPDLPTLYDEPFADSSQIPTLLVCRLARRHVTVALTGDGGDELFGGYTRYRKARDLWSLVDCVGHGARNRLARGIRPLLNAPAPPSTPRGTWLDSQRVRTRGFRALDLSTADSEAEFYRRFMSLTYDTEALLLQYPDPPRTLLGGAETWSRLPDPISRMMAADQVTYLPGDILTKVDRASMGASLEARVPLLDHRVVEMAWRVPPAMRCHDGREKWVLRELLGRFLPRRLFERRKQGFAVPLARWLRGELREWAEPLLSERRISQDGVFRADVVQTLWREHLQERRISDALIWSVLMFQAWLDAWEARAGYRPRL